MEKEYYLHINSSETDDEVALDSNDEGDLFDEIVTIVNDEFAGLISDALESYTPDYCGSFNNNSDRIDAILKSLKDKSELDWRKEI